MDYELTEGDVLAVFAQYGEVVDVNLIKDKSTGKSKGFAFLAYENQKSTILAVDNLSGARVAGRVIRVEHVADYKRKREEDGSDDEAVHTKVPRDDHPTKHPATPPRPSVESSEAKREMPSASDLLEGSIFDQLNAHLKKKQKNFPPAAEASEGLPFCDRYLSAYIECCCLLQAPRDRRFGLQRDESEVLGAPRKDKGTDPCFRSVRKIEFLPRCTER